MPITRSSLSTIPLSIATVSVGTPQDPLPLKLRAISSASFAAVELGFPDLQSFASSFHKKPISADDYNSLCKAGEEVKRLCEKEGLGILMLQPFSNFEGWGKGSMEREEAWERARGWVEIMGAVGTDMLQVGSSNSPNISSDPETLAADLAELADMLVPHNFCIAYENWCWATHAPTWSSVYEIIKIANRPNLGLCLDTFQILSSEYLDPTTPSNLISHLGPLQKLELNLRFTLLSLTSTIPPEKIYVLQISDIYKLTVPFPPDPGSIEDTADPDRLPKEEGKCEEEEGQGMRARAKWSKEYRPAPFQDGRWSRQVVDVARAVLGTGMRT